MTLQRPAGDIRASDAITSEALVSAALGMFGPGDGDEDAQSPPSSSGTTTSPPKSSGASAVAGVARSPLNHLVRKSIISV